MRSGMPLDPVKTVNRGAAYGRYAWASGGTPDRDTWLLPAGSTQEHVKYVYG
jgi:hypothetical protein